jgi:hypothetical protein
VLFCKSKLNESATGTSRTVVNELVQFLLWNIPLADVSVLFIYDIFCEHFQLFADMSLEEYSANMGLCFITFVEG